MAALEREAPATVCGGTPQTLSNRDGEFANAEDLVRQERLQGGGFNGGDGNGFTDGVEHFNGVAVLLSGSGMTVHHLDDIARAESVSGKITGENGVCVEFVDHFSGFLRGSR
jgi:hypothetical protein